MLILFAVLMAFLVLCGMGMCCLILQKNGKQKMQINALRKKIDELGAQKTNQTDTKCGGEGVLDAKDKNDQVPRMLLGMMQLNSISSAHPAISSVVSDDDLMLQTPLPNDIDDENEEDTDSDRELYNNENTVIHNRLYNTMTPVSA